MAQIERVRTTIERLLWYKRAADAATAEFVRLRHNKDLCPLLERKIEDILQRYELHESLVYDIQGRKDEGTDVIVRVGDSPDHAYLCFQIKADYELNEKDLLKTLRSQLVQTQNAYHPLEHYYILIFADEIRRKDRLRDVRQAFIRQPDVSVISPAFLHTFVHLPGLKVDAYIKSLIGIDDIVYRRATEELSGLSPTQAAVIVLLLVKGYFSADRGSTVDELTSSTLLHDWFDLVPDYPSNRFAGPSGEIIDDDELLEYGLLEYDDSLENGEVAGDDDRACEVASEEGSEEPVDLQRELRLRLAEDLDLLENYIELSDDDRYSVNVEAYPAVVALLADGRARFGYESEALVEYGLQTFDVGAVFSRDEVLPV